MLRHPQHDIPSDGCAVPVEPESHKVQRLLVEPADLPVSLQPQADLPDLLLDLFPHAVQRLLVRAENNHIIHISDVVFRPELLFDEEIRLRQEEVCVHLAEQHSDRQPVVHREDLFVQPQETFILDDPPQLFHEVHWLDAGIEFPHIHLQVILGVLPVVAYPLLDMPLALVDAPLRDGSHIQRIEALEKPGLQDQIDTPVDHLVRVESRFTDLPRLLPGSFLDRRLDIR